MTSGLRTTKTLAIVLASAFVFSAPGLAHAGTRATDVAVKRHARHHRHAAIPQHNGGDRDGDNNGARSDGDGNV
jgi:hypothetical protein